MYRTTIHVVLVAVVLALFWPPLEVTPVSLILKEY